MADQVTTSAPTPAAAAQTSSDRQAADAHLWGHKPPGSATELPPETVPAQTTPKKKNTGRRFKCKACGTSFGTVQGRAVHYGQKHGPNRRGAKKPVKKSTAVVELPVRPAFQARREPDITPEKLVLRVAGVVVTKCGPLTEINIG